MIEPECDGEDLVLVNGLFDDGVDFNGVKSEGCGGVDAFQHGRGVAVGVAHFAEGIWVECVETDGDAAQSGLVEAWSFLVEEDAVGGEGEIGLWVLFGELADEVGEVFSEEGFAAGEADFLCSEADENGGEAGDFFVGEDERARQEWVVWTEDFARHAVGAAEVTAIGDGDPKIAEVPAEEICWR